MAQLLSICDEKRNIELGMSMCTALSFGRRSVLYANIFDYRKRTPKSERLDLILSPFSFKDWPQLRQLKIKLQNVPNAMRYALYLLSRVGFNIYSLRALDSAAGTVGLLDVIIYPVDKLEKLPTEYPYTLKELDEYFIDAMALNPWLTKYIRPFDDNYFSISNSAEASIHDVENPWYMNYSVEYRRTELEKERLNGKCVGRFIEGYWCYTPDEITNYSDARSGSEHDRKVTPIDTRPKKENRLCFNVPQGIIDYVADSYKLSGRRNVRYQVVLTPDVERRTLTINFLDPKEELFQLIMDLSDKVGELTEIARVLAESGINQRLVGNTFVEAGRLSEVSLLFDIGKSDAATKEIYYKKDRSKLQQILRGATKIGNLEVKSIHQYLGPIKPKRETRSGASQRHPSRHGSKKKVKGSKKLTISKESELPGINVTGIGGNVQIIVNADMSIGSQRWKPILIDDELWRSRPHHVINKLTPDYFARLGVALEEIKQEMIKGNTAIENVLQDDTDIVKTINEKTDILLSQIPSDEEFHDIINAAKQYHKAQTSVGSLEAEIGIIDGFIPFAKLAAKIDLNKLMKRLQDKALMAYLDYQYHLERIIDYFSKGIATSKGRK